MKHIIIGGVAGGATAAARIRRADENAEIVLVEKGKYISYANCGLPYYIGGVIKSRDKLFVQTPEAFSRRFNVDVRTRHEALSIDTERHEVSIRRADGTTYTETYDRLLLSPGAEPVRPPLEGIDTEGIFTLRNVDDTDRIHSYLGTHRVRHAVVVGGGFIGLEMAENLHHAGAGVSIVEMADQVMAPVDFSIASHVHRHLMDKGVGLWLGRGVEKFTSDNGSIKVWLNTGEGVLYHQKTDIFGRIMCYTFDKEGRGALVRLPVDRVKEIIAMNKSGVIPPKALEATGETGKKELSYTDGVGEDSLSRFDDKKKSRKNKNKNKNNRRQFFSHTGYSFCIQPHRGCVPPLSFPFSTVLSCNQNCTGSKDKDHTDSINYSGTHTACLREI